LAIFGTEEAMNAVGGREEGREEGREGRREGGNGNHWFKEGYNERVEGGREGRRLQGNKGEREGGTKGDKTAYRVRTSVRRLRNRGQKRA